MNWLRNLYWGVRLWFVFRFTRCQDCGRRGVCDDAAVDFAAAMCQRCYDEEMAEYEQAMRKYAMERDRYEGEGC